MPKTKDLTGKQRDALLETLEARFEAHVHRHANLGEVIFADCSAQSPTGRRSVCYDREAREARKEHKPKGSALDRRHDTVFVYHNGAESYYAARGFRCSLKV